MTELTLLTRPGCHLCDDARQVVAEVLAELEAAASGVVASAEERSIVDDPALLDRYSEEIPVLLIDGRVHNIWRIDRERLRSALLATV
jgi:cephalosporin hydroxylase